MTRGVDADGSTVTLTCRLALSIAPDAAAVVITPAAPVAVVAEELESCDDRGPATVLPAPTPACMGE